MTPSAWSSILVQQDIKVCWQPWFLVSFCKINPVKFWVTKRQCRHMSRFAGPTTVRQKICVMWVLTADLSSFREGCCSEDGVTGLSTNIVATFTIRPRGKLCWDFCLINPLACLIFFLHKSSEEVFLFCFFLNADTFQLNGALILPQVTGSRNSVNADVFSGIHWGPKHICKPS